MFKTLVCKEAGLRQDFVFFFRKWKHYATTPNLPRKGLPLKQSKEDTNQSSKQKAKDNLELELNPGVDSKQRWEEKRQTSL